MSIPPKLTAPNAAGKWRYKPPHGEERTVRVDHSPISGLVCRELRMGGAWQFGNGEWEGQWELA